LSANTQPTPTLPIRSPAIAGPIAREIHADRPQGGRGRELIAGHQLRDERLVRRHRHRAPGAQEKSEAQEQGRVDVAGQGKCSQGGTHDHLKQLHQNEQAPAVERVGQRAGGKCKKDVGERICSLD